MTAAAPVEAAPAAAHYPFSGGLMLYWAAIFFVIAIVAAVLGFGGIAAGSAGIAKILFVVFLIAAVISLISGRGRRTLT
jgi:uncharacterized membrane protein YtjA (UPF0391 family)